MRQSTASERGLEPAPGISQRAFGPACPTALSEKVAASVLPDMIAAVGDRMRGETGVEAPTPTVDRKIVFKHPLGCPTSARAVVSALSRAANRGR